MVTLGQLNVFRRVAETGSFSRAADALGVTQPAVSQQIHALEAHFGLRLVELVRGRVRLTDGGRFLAARSDEVLAGVTALERDMREFSVAAAGTLAVGATVTIGTHGLAPLLLRFGRAHPGVDVRITIGNTDTIVAAVRDGSLALALIEGLASGDDLEAIAYQRDELVLVVSSADRRYARRRTLRAAALDGQRFIMREPGSGTRALVDAALERAGVRPVRVLELPSGEAIARAVESGLGIAIVSRMVVERDAAAGRLRIVPIADLDLTRDFLLVRARAYTPSPAARAFARIVLGDGRR
jgi:DNA-binding transcriptional LysR family regulator